MNVQLDLFAPASPSPPPAPHTAGAMPLPRTGAELLAQARSCCSDCGAVGHPCDYTWSDAAQTLRCAPCHARAQGYRAKPNPHGVYCEPGERLTLPHAGKRHALPLVEIRLIDLGPHWIWATEYQLLHGDCRGSSSPLSDWPPRRASGKGAAIVAACDYLRGQLGNVDNPDARRAIKWLADLGQGGLL